MRKVFLQGSYTEQDFEDLLDTRQFVKADCYTISLANGVVLRATSSQQDITIVPPGEVGAQNYSSRQIIAKGLRFKLGIGLEKDEQTMTLSAQPGFVVPYSGDTLEGIPLMESLRRGDFDRAVVTLDRYYAARWGAPWVAGLRLFSGRVGSLDTVGQLVATIKVQSELYILDQQMPKNLYQSSCNNSFCDSRCTLSKVSFAVAGTTETGTSSSKIAWGSSSASYSLGTISIVNNANVAYTRTIRSADNDFLYLANPLDFLPDVGTEFTVFRGCARTLAACDDYSNRAHNYSFPFMPVAETAY